MEEFLAEKILQELMGDAHLKGSAQSYKEAIRQLYTFRQNYESLEYRLTVLLNVPLYPSPDESSPPARSPQPSDPDTGTTHGPTSPAASYPNRSLSWCNQCTQMHYGDRRHKNDSPE